MKKEDVYNLGVKFALPPYNLNNLKGVPNHSNDACLVYPLFMAVEGVIPTYHINSAFWSANSFLVSSNIKEKQIPIYFYVDSRIIEDAAQYFNDAGVDESMILTFTPPERPHEIGDARWLSQKLYIVLDDRFNEFDAVVFIDTDLFLAKPPHSDDRFDISGLFRRSDKKRFATYNIRSSLGQLKPYYDKTSGLGYKRECEIFIEKTYEYLGIKIEGVRNMGGYLNSFCPKFLDNDYKAFIKKMCPRFYNDEAINALYMQKTGKQLEDINKTCGIGVANRNSDFHKRLGGNRCFFTHIDLRYLTDSNETRLWKSAVGINNKGRIAGGQG